MFVNYICMKFVNAHIHQKIELKTLWKHTKALITKPIQIFINNKEKV